MIDAQVEAVKRAPKDKCPARTMPEPADQHRALAIAQSLAGERRQRLLGMPVLIAHQLIGAEADREVAAPFQQAQLAAAGNIGGIDEFDGIGGGLCLRFQHWGRRD